MSRAVKVRLIFDTELDRESQDDIVVVRHPAVAHRLHEAGNGSDHQRNADSREHWQLQLMHSGKKTAARPSLSSNRQPVLELAFALAGANEYAGASSSASSESG